MGERGRGRDRGRGRRSGKRITGTRERRARILIVLGGTRTEPQYFNYVKAALRAGGLDIELIPEGWTPRRLYEHAVELRDAERKNARRRGDVANVYDDVWVVSDVDEFVAELRDVVVKSRVSGIRLAITNPCFEAWLSMHKDDSAAKLDRHQVQARAKQQGLVDPSNPKHLVLDGLRGKFEFAATNARRHAAAHSAASTEFPHDVPSTDVDVLVADLLRRAKQSSPSSEFHL